LAARRVVVTLDLVGRSGRDTQESVRTPAFDSLLWRGGNAIVGVLARLGVGPAQLLTTRGSRTGRPHTVPVVPVEHEGRTWLVAPYGPVAWVRNAREDERVRLPGPDDGRLHGAQSLSAAGPTWSSSQGLQPIVGFAVVPLADAA
jgi:hypothetical protein